MKINYHGYYVFDKKAKTRHLVDIRGFLKAFCKFDSAAFKNQFVRHGESLYFFHLAGDLFLFLMTRSHEVIKRVNKHSLDYKEIYEMLESGDSLGYASYVCFKDRFFGYATTFLAPRINTFSEFVSSIFRSVGLGHYEMVTVPLLHQATRDKLLKMPFLGSARIEMGRDSTFGQDVCGFLGIQMEEILDIGAFEVIIKPKPRKNIRDALAKAIASIPEEGLSKMIVKAKDDLQGQLTDFYLIGQGAIFDVIKAKDEKQIFDLFDAKMASNLILKEKVHEFMRDENLQKGGADSLLHFNNPDSWTDSLLHL